MLNFLARMHSRAGPRNCSAAVMLYSLSDQKDWRLHDVAIAQPRAPRPTQGQPDILDLDRSQREATYSSGM